VPAIAQNTQKAHLAPLQNQQVTCFQCGDYFNSHFSDRIYVAIQSILPGEIEFEWDDGNIRHLAVHGVTPSEFEQVASNEPLVWITSQSMARIAIALSV
jgi:hypothetical protein